MHARQVASVPGGIGLSAKSIPKHTAQVQRGWHKQRHEHDFFQRRACEIGHERLLRCFARHLTSSSGRQQQRRRLQARAVKSDLVHMVRGAFFSGQSTYGLYSSLGVEKFMMKIKMKFKMEA
jgi:hypothetical protein